MNGFLSENRGLRFASFALYYIAQGIPIGLISIALPAWLAEQGVDAADVGRFIAVTGLPWAFKLLAGPVMDRFSFLAMGRRRPWIIAAQFGLLFAMVGMAFVPDPETNIFWLTVLGFLVNCFAAVQDVAVDGMAIDVLPVGERGRANSFMAFGQVAGYAGSGALSAAALVSFGLLGAGLMLALFISFIVIWGVLVRERKGERLLPWGQGEALQRSLDLQASSWREIGSDINKVMFLKASLVLLVATLCWRIAAGFWLVGAPVIGTQDLGYASTDYSYWTSIFAVIAAVLGLGLGPFVDRLGPIRIFTGAAVLMGLMYIATGMLVEHWQVPELALMVMAGEALTTQAIFISFIALHMNVCWIKVSATQFAIYMAWSNLGRSIGAEIYGTISEWLVPGQEFLIMGLLMFGCAGLLQLVNMERHQKTIDHLQQGEALKSS